MAKRTRNQEARRIRRLSPPSTKQMKAEDTARAETWKRNRDNQSAQSARHVLMLGCAEGEEPESGRVGTEVEGSAAWKVTRA